MSPLVRCDSELVKLDGAVREHHAPAPSTGLGGLCQGDEYRERKTIKSPLQFCAHRVKLTQSVSYRPLTCFKATDLFLVYR